MKRTRLQLRYEQTFRPRLEHYVPRRAPAPLWQTALKYQLIVLVAWFTILGLAWLITGWLWD